MDIKKPCFRQLHFGRKAPKHTLEHIFWQSKVEPPRFCRYTFDLLAVSGIWPAFRRQCPHMNSFTEAAEKSIRFVRRTPWQRRPYMRWINTCFYYIPLWCFEVPVCLLRKPLGLWRERFRRERALKVTGAWHALRALSTDNYSVFEIQIVIVSLSF